MRRMRAGLRAAAVLWAGAAFAPAAQGATCPFNIPVVTLPPHQQGGFVWGWPIHPMGDPCVTAIAVEPTNSAAWYVGGLNGLYMTKTAGQTWTNPVSGGQATALLLVPGVPQLVYVALGQRLYLSRDKGLNWTLIHIYPRPVTSLLVTGGTLYVGLSWSNHVQPSGVWKSNLGAGGAVFQPFGPGQTGLIVHTLARDPVDGSLYAGTEIFDHPIPYEPPFFRSADEGVTWTDVSNGLPLHVIASEVRPTDEFVYALTEGLGLYGSADQGASWQQLSVGGPSASLLMHPAVSTRLFGGRHNSGPANGGAFQSLDGGLTFQPIGLPGVTVADFALSGASMRLFVAAYASGIYVSPVP